MANLEALDATDVIAYAAKINGGQPEHAFGELAVQGDMKAGGSGAVEEHGSGEETTTPLEPSLASPKDSTPSESMVGTENSTPHPVLNMPHPKKFSHVNINKKFLEKASSATVSGQTAVVSPLARTGSSSRTSHFLPL